MNISYKKSLDILEKNNLFDGFMFVVVIKSYIIWGQNFIMTTNGNMLTITPFGTINKPNINKSKLIYKENIQCFKSTNNFFTKRKFKIVLKSGEILTYITDDTQIKERVDILNKWLQV